MHVLAFRGLRLPIGCLVTLVLAACQASGTADRHDRLAQFNERTGPMVFDARALVIGNHAGSVSQVVNDLRQMGFALVERDRVAQFLDDREVEAKPAAEPESELLRRGFLAGAEMLVIVRIDGSRQVPGVHITGIDVENGTILWMGGVVASEPVAESDYHHRLVEFARQALIDGMTTPDGGTSARFSHH